MLAILRSGNADVNLADGTATRPVFLAVRCCSTVVLQELLERKVDLEARDADGHTPLLLAVLLAVGGSEGGAAVVVDGVKAAVERASMIAELGELQPCGAVLERACIASSAQARQEVRRSFRSHRRPPYIL